MGTGDVSITLGRLTLAGLRATALASLHGIWREGRTRWLHCMWGCVCAGSFANCFNSLFLLPQLEPSPRVTHSAHISGERGTNGVPNKPPGDGLCVHCPPVFRGQVTGCVKGKGLRDGPRGAPQALASYLGQQLWVLTGMWAATPTRAGGKTLYQEHADTAKIFSLGKEKETYGFCITECQKVMRFL